MGHSGSAGRIFRHHACKDAFCNAKSMLYPFILSPIANISEDLVNKDKNYITDFSNSPTMIFHPSISTKNKILNGSETTVGGNIIMPIDIVIVATTKSIIKNGNSIKKPISNPRLSSESKNAGKIIDKVGSISLVGSFDVFLLNSANNSRSSSRTC